MLAKLDEVEARFNEIEERLGDPNIYSNQDESRKLSKERASLEEVVYTYREYKQILKDIEDNELMIQEETDREMIELAKEDLARLKEEQESLEQKLKILLIPKDPNDDKNILLEIRAGAGGDEAGIFAADLFRLYTKYAESKGWKVELMSASSTGVGGFKEVIAMIEGNKVYSLLKYESGVHRVQRVPKTEAQGRIHTSTVTVAILPEADEVEVNIDPQELRIDVYRSSGPGGQSVNTTDSAVRITHVPTGLVVACQDEKSQHKNKAKALKILQARLYDKIQSEQQAEIAADRRSQVGTGDRSERIRTYNFPQGRLSDHRIGLTLYKLETIMEGHLDEVVEALTAHYQAEALKKSEE